MDCQVTLAPGLPSLQCLWMLLMHSDTSVFSQLHFLVGVASKNKLIEGCKGEVLLWFLQAAMKSPANGGRWHQDKGTSRPLSKPSLEGKKAVTNVVQNCNFCNWKHSPGFVILQQWGNTWDFNLWRTAFPYKSQSVI